MQPLRQSWYQGNQPPYYSNKQRPKILFKRKLVLVLVSIVLLSIALPTVAFALFGHSATTRANGIGDSGVRTLQPVQNQQQKGFMQNNGQMQNNRPVASINGLTRISVVGSTAFILDARGHTISVDANPYGVAIAPPSTPVSNVPGSLRAGDIVVTNIGGNDTGTTLVRFPAKMGPGRLFNTMTSPGTKGPADQAFNTLTGTDWVSNVSGNNVQIFKPDGTVLVTITNPMFNKPWGQAFNHGIHNPQDGAVGSFFATNVANATIVRIDVIPAKGLPTFKVFQIGQLTSAGKETKIGVTWIPSLQIGGHLFSDVLLALDPANNRIAAYPNSTTSNTTSMRSTSKGITVFQGKPLNMPGGLAINPLNGDLLVVNLNDNNLVELNMSQGKVVGTRLLDNVPVDPMSGNGSALFGVAATTDSKGNLAVFFTDDNTNTLDELSV
jgi:hypothetical protein